MPNTKNYYTIPQAAKHLDFSEAYVRTLIREGRLKAVKRPVDTDSEVLRYETTEEWMQTFLDTSKRKNKRRDGRNKYLLYATPIELEEAVRVLKAAGRTTSAIAELIVPANLIKPRRQK